MFGLDRSRTGQALCGWPSCRMDGNKMVMGKHIGACIQLTA